MVKIIRSSAHHTFNCYFSLQNKYHFLTQDEVPLLSTASGTSQADSNTCLHKQALFKFSFSALPLTLLHHQLSLAASSPPLSLSLPPAFPTGIFSLLPICAFPSGCELSYISTELSNLKRSSGFKIRQNKLIHQ